MTNQRDIARVLDIWLNEGPTDVPDRVLDEAVARLRRERQRSAWRLHWRNPAMIMPFRLAAAAVAIVALVVLGIAVLRPTSSFGPLPSPTPTASEGGPPTAPPSAGSPCIGGDCEGSLAAGRHRADAPLVPFRYTVADGWANVFNTMGGYVLRRQDGGPPGHGLYVFYDLQAADQDACVQARAPGVGSTAAELVAWLQSVPGISMTNRSSPTVGGLSGQAFDLTLSGDRLQCQGEAKLFVQEWSGDAKFWWGIPPGERQHVILLDRGSGGAVFIIVVAPDAQFAPFADLVSPILGSIVFDDQCATDEPTCIGPLARGTHSSGSLITPFTYTVPVGWSKSLDVPGSLSLEASQFAGSSLGLRPDWVIADQDACTSDAEPGLGRTVDDLVTFLVEHPGLITTPPASTTVGSLDGQVVDLRMDPAFAGPCPGEVNLFTHDGTIDDVGWWLVGQPVNARYWILDAGGGRTITVMLETVEAADWDALVEAAMPVIDSFVFAP